MQSSSRVQPAVQRPGRLALVHFLALLVLLAAILVACATESKISQSTAFDQAASPSPSATVTGKKTATWSERNMNRP